MEFDPKTLRKTVLEMAYAGSTVHIGCAFSIIELLSILYKNHLRYPQNNPLDKNRDYFILSKGHGVMAQYSCMRELGWLCDDDFSNYFSDGSDLKGLADSRIPGILRLFRAWTFCWCWLGNGGQIAKYRSKDICTSGRWGNK